MRAPRGAAALAGAEAMTGAGAGRPRGSASIAILSELDAEAPHLHRRPEHRNRALGAFIVLKGHFMASQMYRRILTIVIDSIGVGDAPDADKYNSDGADTLGHMAQWWVDNQGRPLALPTMERLGLATQTAPTPSAIWHNGGSTIRGARSRSPTWSGSAWAACTLASRSPA